MITFDIHGYKVPIPGVTQEELDRVLAAIAAGPDADGKLWFRLGDTAIQEKLASALCMTRDEWFATPGMDDFVPPDEALLRISKRYGKRGFGK